MPDEISSPTPDQLWEKAAAYLESGETDGAQKCLLHWALLLDAATKKEWLDRVPPELFNAVSCIVQTAETVSANPNDTALAWVSIGQVWLDRDQPEWAHSCFEKGTATGPNIAMAHHQLGISWHKKDDVAKAQESFQQASKLNPGDAGTWHNLGKCHQDAGRNDRAAEAYETALAIEPDHPLAGVSLASILLAEFDIAEANARLSAVIGQHPDNAAARHNRSQILLLQGQFKQGWIDFGYRFLAGTREHYPVETHWNGESIADKHLLVHFEQGLGDTIMFSRFLPRVQRLCGQLTFECQRTLVELFRHSFPGIDIVVEGEAPTDFDLHLPLLTLGERLGLDETNLLGDRAYLTSPGHAALPDSRHLRVGLAWAGNPHEKNDPTPPIAWKHFAALTGSDGIDFFSLQVGPRAADCEGSEVVSLKGQFNDVAATAAVIGQLDLVITVDTAVAHLAGALGKSTWVLLPSVPDWRWQLHRTDTPWYSQVKLYRRDAGDVEWAKTLDRIRQDLAKRLA